MLGTLLLVSCLSTAEVEALLSSTPQARPPRAAPQRRCRVARPGSLIGKLLSYFSQLHGARGNRVIMLLISDPN